MRGRERGRGPRVALEGMGRGRGGYLREGMQGVWWDMGWCGPVRRRGLFVMISTRQGSRERRGSGKGSTGGRDFSSVCLWPPVPSRPYPSHPYPPRPQLAWCVSEHPATTVSAAALVPTPRRHAAAGRIRPGRERRGEPGGSAIPHPTFLTAARSYVCDLPSPRSHT